MGLVVDDKDAVRKALADAGIQPMPGPFLDFLDPWGNRIEIVSYDNIQFTKARNVLRGMGLTHLVKNAKAFQRTHREGHGTDLGRLLILSPPVADVRFRGSTDYQHLISGKRRRKIANAYMSGDNERLCKSEVSDAAA